jgi:hypothetical protein
MLPLLLQDKNACVALVVRVKITEKRQLDEYLVPTAAAPGDQENPGQQH